MCTFERLFYGVGLKYNSTMHFCFPPGGGDLMAYIFLKKNEAVISPCLTLHTLILYIAA